MATTIDGILDLIVQDRRMHKVKKMQGSPAGEKKVSLLLLLLLTSFSPHSHKHSHEHSHDHSHLSKPTPLPRSSTPTHPTTSGSQTSLGSLQRLDS